MRADINHLFTISHSTSHVHNQRFFEGTYDPMHLPNRLIDCIDPIEACETAYDVFKYLTAFSDKIGAARFTVVNTAVEAETLRSMVLVNNWQPAAVSRYDSLHLAKDCPILRHLSRGERGRTYDAAFLTQDRPPPLRDLTLSFFNDYRMGEGLVVPTANQRNGTGGLCFSSRKFKIERSDLHLTHLICTYLYDHLAKIERQARDDVRSIKLTCEEKRCLRRIAGGQTTKEAAYALGMSDKSFDYHIASAGKKLGSCNRIHSVATAIRKGLLN